MTAFAYIPRFSGLSHLTGETPVKVWRTMFRGHLVAVPSARTDRDRFVNSLWMVEHVGK